MSIDILFINIVISAIQTQHFSATHVITGRTLLIKLHVYCQLLPDVTL